MAPVASVATGTEPQYDRKTEVKAFDETKGGVKGLLDAGVTELPRIFVKEQPQLLDHLIVEEEAPSDVPIIDFRGVNDDAERRKEIVREILDAFDSWGYFEIINHGIPQSMLDEISEGVRKFHELDAEVKKSYYSREFKNLPEICRDIIMEYSKEMMRLGDTLFELFSEALGLPPNHLKDIDCTEHMMLLGHYYPPCPEPEKAIGINNHKDNDFLTILLQDHIGGLQVLHHDKWVEVPYIPGALVINTGDLLQLVSNDKLKSVVHRVQPKKVGPRISVAAFFRAVGNNPRLLGPIKEILSEDNPPLYGDCTTKEYLDAYLATGQDGTPALDKFKL
ncbi:hypothetical protein Ancab_039920 [Ancistrocladus abbreviatus]